MVRLYLVRHAIAEEPAGGAPRADAFRALTAKGRRRFRRGARAFARLGEDVELICSSPILRAVQTAELLASALGRDDVRVLEELGRNGAVAQLLAVLPTLGVGSVALVGHRRLLKELAVMLSGVAFGEAARVRLKRGAIARIDARKMSADSGEPRWWLAPAGQPVRDGLPLEGASR